jgi:hypothetical protein
MSTERLTHEEQQAIRKTILRVHEQGWGLAFGLVLGVGLLAATNILVLRGGPSVGTHLRLLGVYFPGYTVTVVGSFIGFVYAFVVGYGIGRLIATAYNRLTSSMR